MVNVWKKINGFIKIIIIVSFTLIIFSLNPRVEKLNFEFQTKSFKSVLKCNMKFKTKKPLKF